MSRPRSSPSAAPGRIHSPRDGFDGGAGALVAGAVVHRAHRLDDPTVRVGDRVLVSRLSYRVGDIKRGDVIVFDGAGVFEPEPAPARNALAGAGRAISSAFGLPVGSRDYVK